MPNNKSEEIEEILGRAPSWIMKWGISWWFAVIVMLLAGSIWIKYPDKITVPIRISTSHPAVDLNIQGRGGVIEKMMVHEGDTVQKGQLILTLESAASVHDVFALEDKLQEAIDNNTYSAIEKASNKWQLGELSRQYAQFLGNWKSFSLIQQHDPEAKKLFYLKQQILKYKQYLKNIGDQHQKRLQGLTISQGMYSSDSSLYQAQAISKFDWAQSRQKRLQEELAVESDRTSMDQAQIRLLELQQQQEELQVRRSMGFSRKRQSLTRRNKSPFGKH